MNHKIAYAYRKQKFTKRPKNVLDAYYRRPLFDSEAWQKRSSTRPRTRQHTPNYKMTLSTRMDPSSPNYRIGSLNGYDNPIEFDYMQNEVNEHKRQQYRQEHNVEEEWEIERREQEAKRNPVISISPIKRRRKKKKRTTTRNKTNHQDQRNEDNSTTKSTHSTSSLQSKVIDPAKIKQRRAATRERKIKAIERLNKMAAPREQKVLANQEFRAKLKTKHLPPTQIAHLLHPNRGVATPMSDKTLHWIEHASRAKEAKLQALEEFQLRLKETKMSPADRTHRQNQRPKTTLSPVRAAWCRTASKPRRIATPYVSPSISGAFGCSGTRFVGESEFTSKIGPGDYGIVDDPMTRSNTGACKFNLSVTKDVIDLAVFAKAGIPGPGKYGVCDNPNTITNAGGGKFNLSITMDTIDQAVFLRREGKFEFYCFTFCLRFVYVLSTFCLRFVYVLSTCCLRFVYKLEFQQI